MPRLGTPLTPSATRIMLLGAGELGREVAIELIRLGCEVIACDRYDHAPAMQVAQHRRVVAMRDPAALRAVIAEVAPTLIVPEIEAIATEVLVEAEAAGTEVVPTARAAQLTMDREGIRRLAAETLGLPTSTYRFASTRDELDSAIGAIGYPFVIKPTMSSSGKGQSLVRDPSGVDAAWAYAQSGGRVGTGRVIIEGFVRFDYEITMLTVAAADGLHCLEPVGHIQIRGDYRESWQPCAMSPLAQQRAEAMAKTVVGELCRRADGQPGRGLFGVECFVRGDEVIFSEVSPRPHDTGLVTLGSQALSEFALHARAILGLPVGPVRLLRPAASVAILGRGEGVPTFAGLGEAHRLPETRIHLFGKPLCTGIRRLGVAIAAGDDVAQARHRARQAAAGVRIHLDGATENAALPYPEDAAG